MLPNGLADLALYEVENSYDNRILLADFIPEGFDQEEEEADAILMEKWQEHINAIDCANSPDKDNNLLSSGNIDKDA